MLWGTLIFEQISLRGVALSANNIFDPNKTSTNFYVRVEFMYYFLYSYRVKFR